MRIRSPHRTCPHKCSTVGFSFCRDDFVCHWSQALLWAQDVTKSRESLLEGAARGKEVGVRGEADFEVDTW